MEGRIYGRQVDFFIFAHTVKEYIKRGVFLKCPIL